MRGLRHRKLLEMHLEERHLGTWRLHAVGSARLELRSADSP